MRNNTIPVGDTWSDAKFYYIFNLEWVNIRKDVGHKIEAPE